MTFFRGCLVLICVLSLFYFPSTGRAGDDPGVSRVTDDHPWAVTLFSGAYTNRTVGIALSNVPGALEKNYMHSLALSRRLVRFWNDWFTLEAEGMVAHHDGKHQTGRQSYQEYVAALLARYDHFPWNDYLHTSIAVGQGLSLASNTPEREVQIRGNSQELLNYLAFELELTMPRYPGTVWPIGSTTVRECLAFSGEFTGRPIIISWDCDTDSDG